MPEKSTDCFTTLTLQPKLHHNARKEDEKRRTRGIVGYLVVVSGIFHRQKKNSRIHVRELVREFSLIYLFLA